MSLISLESKAKVTKFFKQIATKYGGEVGQQYAATPSVAQTLNEAIIVDGNWFLKLINIVPVPEIKGEKVFLGLAGHVTGRTNTGAGGEREAKRLIDMNAEPYELHKTDSDVALGYATVDVWAKFKQLAKLFGKAVREAIGNDRIMIGWVGTSAAVDTVEADLSDVNIGWLEQIRTYNAGAQYVLGAGGSVTLGGATFPNLDTLVHDAKSNIEERFRKDPDLVVLLGSNVMAAADGSYYEAVGDTPTEKDALVAKKSAKTYGGLAAYEPPYFDPDSILVTSLKNLSIYWQETSWRRQQIDNPKRDQYEDFNTRQEGYIVEQLGKTSLVQGIEYS